MRTVNIALILSALLFLVDCAAVKNPLSPPTTTATDTTVSNSTSIPWDGNVLSNADFETVAGSPLQPNVTTNDGWAQWSTKGYTNTSRSDATNSVSGSYSVRFDNPVNTIYPMVWQYVYIDSSSTYTISGSICANTVEQNPLNNEGVKVMITTSNGGGTLWSYHATNNTSGWTNFSSNWSSGAYRCVRVYVAHREAAGTAWFDNISLKKN